MDSVSGGSTAYSITELQPGASYTITVVAVNAMGSASSDPVTALTGIHTVRNSPLWHSIIMWYILICSSVKTHCQHTH